VRPLYIVFMLYYVWNSQIECCSCQRFTLHTSKCIVLYETFLSCLKSEFTFECVLFIFRKLWNLLSYLCCCYFTTIAPIIYDSVIFCVFQSYGSTNVLDCARQWSIKIIHVSSELTGHLLSR